MPLPSYDADQEATGFVNEMFYRDGPDPKAIDCEDALLVHVLVREYLREAYAAGAKEA